MEMGYVIEFDPFYTTSFHRHYMESGIRHEGHNVSRILA